MECVDFATSPKRRDGSSQTPLAHHEICTRAFHAKETFFAVFWPSNKRAVVSGFWSGPGAGISSRFAAANLTHIHQLYETDIPSHESMSARPAFEGPSHDLVRGNILQALMRTPLDPVSNSRVTMEDIYFFQTGMAAIYKTHSYLAKTLEGTTVLFGMAFMDTVKVLQEYGRNFKFFGMGHDGELEDLAKFLEEERTMGRKVQSIWTEIPANPLLVTPDVRKLRLLADEYETLLIIDDTVGSWANIDVMGFADMIVTSLTKSFNGYADVIAGSIILNPLSRANHEIRGIFEANYIPELYVQDAQTIARNSQDYLARTQKLNHNARTLAEYLESCTQSPGSAVSLVYYPTINSSGSYYRQLMRPATEHFKPGFGCLFAVEFEDLAATEAFYDNLNVHKGPHLGAPFTLAFAYTMCAYKSKLDWASKYGLRPTQLRISAGLEDTATLLQDFKVAVAAASRVNGNVGP